jgi:transcriptional regulator with XRE-family HTH domain
MEEMYNVEESGIRLKELRKKKGITQEQAAKDMKLSAETVRKNEQGVRGLSIDMAEIYAQYYETSIDYIVNGTVNRESQLGDMLGKYSEEKQEMALKILKGILENLE